MKCAAVFVGVVANVDTKVTVAANNSNDDDDVNTKCYFCTTNLQCNPVGLPVEQEFRIRIDT